MLHQTWKVFTIVFVALFVGFLYYFSFSHIESSKYVLYYLLTVASLYFFYKVYHIVLEYDVIEFGVGKILTFGCLHLLVLCFFFFFLSGLPAVYGFVLFAKILLFLVLVFGLHSLIYLFGKSVLGYLLHSYESKSPKDKLWNFIVSSITHTTLFSKKEQVLVSYGIGIVMFFFSLSLLAFFKLYSITYLFFLLGGFFAIAFREIIPTWKSLRDISWSFENHNFDSGESLQYYRPYLISTELLFLVLTGIISVSFISVFRAFPIGWDDLGVYMNYPKLLVENLGNMPLGSMYPWQLYTGIGYLFHSQTFAFFLNSFASIMSLGVIYLGFSSLFSDQKKSFFNIPLLSATIFLGLPMVVFQTAKDMKLDIGLFSLSFLALVLVYFLYSRISRLDKKHIITILFLIGALLGLVFTIKVTSLLLISGIFGVVFYFFGGYFGFLSYIFFYISVFTYFGLWSIMNVIFPTDNVLLTQIVSGISLMISGVCFFTAFSKKYQSIRDLSLHIFIIFLGIIFSFFPWGLKNISELASASQLSIYSLIGGKAEYFIPNYLDIYDTNTLAEKQKFLETQIIDENGNTKNEDWGRYFGYESGINNYLKLPWNLTMQVNQKGEFTDIGFLFFAFVPTIFLLLPSKKIYFPYILGTIVIFSFLYFIPSPASKILNQIGDIFTLPYGYLAILGLYLAGTTFLVLSLEKRDKTIELFLYNLIFASFFVFLWTISAFGVVWYGITMYGSFLLMIVLSYWQICSYESSESLQERETKLQNSSFIFGIFVIYIILSIIPRYINNLATAGFPDYKVGQYSENRTIFTSHPEYLLVLFTLNIDDSKKESFISDYKTQIFKILSRSQLNKQAFDYLDSITNISALESFILQFLSLTDPNPTSPLLITQKDLKILLEDLYTNLIYPSVDIKSQQKIYKMGTFMRYFISQNNQRIHDDSLLTSFDTYFYDVNPDILAERIKKLDMDYLLIDLNAATIDNDPRHDLTRRYENLLSSLIGDKFELIDSDSICLKVALEDYKRDSNKQKYMETAGVNYESYLQGGGVISRRDKLQKCHMRIIEILSDTSVDLSKNYVYLSQILSYMQQNKISLDNTEALKNLLAQFGVGYKALFKIL